MLKRSWQRRTRRNLGIPIKRRLWCGWRVTSWSCPGELEKSCNDRCIFIIWNSLFLKDKNWLNKHSTLNLAFNNSSNFWSQKRGEKTNKLFFSAIRCWPGICCVGATQWLAGISEKVDILIFWRALPIRWCYEGGAWWCCCLRQRPKYEFLGARDTVNTWSGGPRILNSEIVWA